MRLFGKTSIDFMGKRYLWYTVSTVLILAGMVSLFTKGVELGNDFLGGTEVIIKFEQPVSISDLRSVMDKSGISHIQIKSFGSPQDILMRTTEQGQGTTVRDRIEASIRAGLPSNPFVIGRGDIISPKIGSELRRDAIYAVIATLVAIWIYIGFRFKFIYGVGAVAALFHDVLVTLGMVSIFNGVFNLEIDQNMIAAFLTLVGLSVNDTVVIFDRIRENQKIFRSMPLKELMNKSLNETLSRTIITSGTIFIVLVVMLAFGGEVNRGFSFALTVGIITGTYSSIYIASAVVLEYVLSRKQEGKLID
jgi:preprotein translocase subunit SecF